MTLNGFANNLLHPYRSLIPSFLPHLIFNIKQNKLYKSMARIDLIVLPLANNGPLAIKIAFIEGSKLS